MLNNVFKHETFVFVGLCGIDHNVYNKIQLNFGFNMNSHNTSIKIR